MADGPRVTAADLELGEAGAAQTRSLREAREDVERQMIQQALQRHGGKIARAAEDLGISRPTFYELMEKLGLPRSP